MSGLVGKMISRVEDYGDRLFFADGTSLEIGEHGGRYLDYAETQAHLHEQQGHREVRRMRQLHDSLHPRDQQYLKRLEDARREQRRQSMSAFERAVESVFGEQLRAEMVAANSMFFGGLWPKQKRKRRPPRRRSPAEFYKSGEVVIPIGKRR